MRWDELTLRERLDVAYAAQIEPFMHGSLTTVDKIVDEWDGILADTMPDRDSFGVSAASAARNKAAEDRFGQARPLPPDARRNRPTPTVAPE